MTITIPQKLTQGKELIVIPREEYEELLELRKVYEFKASDSQKKALDQARKRRAKGEVLTLRELKNKLGFTD